MAGGAFVFPCLQNDPILKLFRVPGLNLGLVVTLCHLGRKVLQAHGGGECLADSAKIWSEGV